MSHSASLRIAWLGHRSDNAGDGLITYSRETVAALRARNVEVLFAHFERGAFDSDSFVLDAYTRSHRFVVPRIGSARRLVEALRDTDVDVVHASLSWSMLDFNLPRICEELKVPLVATFHVPFSTRGSLWQFGSTAMYTLFSRTLARCQAVIIFGGPQRLILERLGVPAGVIHAVPNGVDTAKYVPRGTRATPEDDRFFTYVGRLDPEKNVGMLAAAFLAVDPPPNMKLIVVGDGVERRKLENRYRDPRIIFTGLITDEARRISILQSSEAFFLPSTVEGLSLSMLEAMACGNAIVASDAGNDGAAIRGAGIVLDPRQMASELRVAVRLLVENPELGRLLGEQARKRVESRYSMRANVDALLALYRWIIDRESFWPREAERARAHRQASAS